MGRPGLPPDKRQQVWQMWKVGNSISEIAREVGSPPGSIFSILLPHGGIYQPLQRRRAGCLTLIEREEISRGLAADESYQAIGRRLGRPASTIRREVAKNKGRRRYRAVDADDRAWRRAKRPKRCLLAVRRPLLLYADRGSDHDKYRRLLRQRGIIPRIARRGTAHGSGWYLERTFAWLHTFQRLRTRNRTTRPSEPGHQPPKLVLN